MSNNRTRISVVAALLAGAALIAAAANAYAISLSLGVGGPTVARVDLDRTSALYATDLNGRTLQIARVGAKAPGGGTFSELGVPMMGDDGWVLFGADVQHEIGHFGWAIFKGKAEYGRVRIVQAVDLEHGNCKPAFRSDPSPVIDRAGNIVFVAREDSGRDGLFLYSNGELICLAKVGDITRRGHKLAVLVFGTAQIGHNGEVIARGWLNGDRAALLRFSRDGGIDELAVSGESSPGGARYSNTFGIPAAVDSPEGTVIAFTNKTSSGTALFLYRAHEMARILPFGAQTAMGPVSFLSLGKPALAPDGTTAVLAGVARVSVLLRLERGNWNTAIRGGDITPLGAELLFFGDPQLTDSGDLFFGGVDSNDRESVYVLKPGGGLTEPGSSLIGAIHNIVFNENSDSGVSHAHYIFSGTLTVNYRGEFAYLGGK